MNSWPSRGLPAPVRDGTRERLGWVMMFVAVIGTMALVGYHLSSLLTTTAIQSQPDPVADSTTPPGSGVLQWSPPTNQWEPLPSPAPGNDNWQVLQTAALYQLAPPTMTGCPEVRAPASFEEFQEDVTAQWDCVHAAWAPELERLGYSSAKPALEFFHGTGTNSACGYLDAPAYYCSASGGTGYFGDGHFAMAQRWSLSVNEMVNHEYGHHLQSVTGITAAKVAESSDEVERRTELQAVCWSAMMTWNNQAVTQGQATYDSWLRRLGTMQADDVHGSSASLRAWGLRGLSVDSVGQCNTWVAPPEWVN